MIYHKKFKFIRNISIKTIIFKPYSKDNSINIIYYYLNLNNIYNRQK